jgi:uncharacterized protein with HEPN domain
MVPPGEALDDILRFIDDLARHAPTDVATLEGDVVRSRFVLHTLTLIGEATRRLSDAFRAAHPAVPWGKLLGVRNRVVHEYGQVDYDLVSHIVAIEMPALRLPIADLRATLPETDRER